MSMSVEETEAMRFTVFDRNYEVASLDDLTKVPFGQHLVARVRTYLEWEGQLAAVFASFGTPLDIRMFRARKGENAMVWFFRADGACDKRGKEIKEATERARTLYEALNPKG